VEDATTFTIFQEENATLAVDQLPSPKKDFLARQTGSQQFGTITGGSRLLREACCQGKPGSVGRNAGKDHPLRERHLLSPGPGQRRVPGDHPGRWLREVEKNLQAKKGELRQVDLVLSPGEPPLRLPPPGARPSEDQTMKKGRAFSLLSGRARQPAGNPARHGTGDRVVRPSFHHPLFRLPPERPGSPLPGAVAKAVRDRSPHRRCERGVLSGPEKPPAWVRKELQPLHRLQGLPLLQGPGADGRRKGGLPHLGGSPGTAAMSQRRDTMRIVERDSGRTEFSFVPSAPSCSNPPGRRSRGSWTGRSS